MLMQSVCQTEKERNQIYAFHVFYIQSYSDAKNKNKKRAKTELLNVPHTGIDIHIKWLFLQMVIKILTLQTNQPTRRREINKALDFYCNPFPQTSSTNKIFIGIYNLQQKKNNNINLSLQ